LSKNSVDKKTVLLRQYTMRTVVRSYFPIIPPEFDFFPFRVSRVGHVISTPRFIIDREYFPGVEILFAYRGNAWVRSRGKDFPVLSGQIAWLDNTRPHGHWPDPADPWEVYWLRFDSPFLERLQNSLAVDQNPVFSPGDRGRIESLFGAMFNELDEPSVSTAATINSLVAQLVEEFFRARRDQLANASGGPEHPHRLSRLYHTVMRSFHEPWDANRMAAELAVSPAHMYRIFRSAVGMSPHRWLRSIRIEQARRRLGETDELIGEIALKVGYRDQFHFSRDFHAVTGVSPREFRKHERFREVPPAADADVHPEAEAGAGAGAGAGADAGAEKDSPPRGRRQRLRRSET
jgi:AraC-like DNA-binding protein